MENRPPQEPDPVQVEMSALPYEELEAKTHEAHHMAMREMEKEAKGLEFDPEFVKGMLHRWVIGMREMNRAEKRSRGLHPARGIESIVPNFERPPDDAA